MSVSPSVTPPVPARATNIMAALFWMVMALASFTMVAVAGRTAGRDIDTAHLIFFRSAIALGMVTLLIFFSVQGMHQIRTQRIGLHATRNVIHFIAQYCWLSSLMLIPLAQLISIEFTAPLWVAVLAPLLLGEKLTVTRIIAAVIGFAGIVIIVQPGAVPMSAGTVFAMVAALGFATSMIATKRLVPTETVLCILFHMSWMQLVIAGVPILHDLKAPALSTFPWITAMAAAAMMAHFSLARAFSHADAIIVAPMDFLRLPLTMVVGFMLYGEPVEPVILIGAAVVVVANVINIFGERRRS